MELKAFLLPIAGLAWLAACSPGAQPAGSDGGSAGSTASANFDQTAAEAEILAWARASFNKDGGSLIEPVNTFFGDYSGDGAPDALAFSYFDTGGSSASLDVSIFKNEGGHMVHDRVVEVYGMEPRDAKFESGRITVTTLMPGPDDPLCCPTQPHEWTVETN